MFPDYIPFISVKPQYNNSENKTKNTGAHVPLQIFLFHLSSNSLPLTESETEFLYGLFRPKEKAA
jgi:hypothetical protein